MCARMCTWLRMYPRRMPAWRLYARARARMSTCSLLAAHLRRARASSTLAHGTLNTMAALPSSELLHSIRDVAVKAARAAGELIRTRAGVTAVETAKATSQDLVTVVDKQCQLVIERAVVDAFPEHAFLGEENVPPGAEASAAAIGELLTKEWLWYVPAGE
ncbi:hypothetical protein EON67_10950 [archaeon]|nr:MAG: hypothetical protein EON67_10950 [archaeon]